MIIIELTKKIAVGNVNYRAYNGKIGYNLISFRVYTKADDVYVVTEVFNGKEAIGENVIYGSIQNSIESAKILLEQFLGEEVTLLD